MLPPRKTALTALAVALLALPARAADAEKYLPEDARAVISFNVRQFLDSPLIKKANLEKALASDEEAQKVLKDIGLDPLKDVDRLVIAGAGKAEKDDQLPQIGIGTDPPRLHGEQERNGEEVGASDGAAAAKPAIA